MADATQGVRSPVDASAGPVTMAFCWKRLSAAASWRVHGAMRGSARVGDHLGLLMACNAKRGAYIRSLALELIESDRVG